jgi:hypothetical protein
MTNGTKPPTSVRRPAGALNLCFEAASGGHAQILVNASHANCRKGGGGGQLLRPQGPGNYSQATTAPYLRGKAARTAGEHGTIIGSSQPVRFERPS